jgi:hypothetical protein
MVARPCNNDLHGGKPLARASTDVSRLEARWSSHGCNYAGQAGASPGRVGRERNVARSGHGGCHAEERTWAKQLTSVKQRRRQQAVCVRQEARSGESFARAAFGFRNNGW